VGLHRCCGFRVGSVCGLGPSSYRGQQTDCPHYYCVVSFRACIMLTPDGVDIDRSSPLTLFAIHLTICRNIQCDIDSNITY
jgi:hypothetical protein